MIKKTLLLLFVVMSQLIFAQVGINTVNPNPLTVLDVELTLDGAEVIPKGVMVPRMTEEQRNGIDVSDTNNPNSLLIYNTTEDCFNYYSKTDANWVSLCGARSGRAVFTLVCDQVAVNGIYTISTALNSSNFVEVKAIVTKAGSYNISGITRENNGYYFSLIGEFLEPGTYLLQIPGFGTPKVFTPVGRDQLYLRNNNALLCDNTFPIILRQAEYEIDCNSVTVHGTIIAGEPLTAQNTITANVTADAELAGRQYSVQTDIVNGYSYKGSGTLVEGIQEITLTGSGTPITHGNDQFILKNNSLKEDIPSCTAVVNVKTRLVRVLSLSNSSSNYNIGSSKNYANSAMMNPDYFSLNTGATYAVSGFKFSSVTSSNKLQAALQSFTPDIIIAQYNYSPSSAEVTLLADFVSKGGVFIYCTDSGTSSNIVPLIQSMLTSDATIIKAGTDSDNVVTLLNSGTTITNGPFQDLVGKGMARDAGGNFGIVATSLPASEIDVIAYTSDGTAARMFAHKTKGFVFVGDGGPFAASTNTTSAYSQPAKFIEVNGNYIAAIDTGSDPDSYNSYLFLNTIAWAIEHIKESGMYPKE